MRAEFFRPDASKKVVGTAEWDGRRAVIDSQDEEVRAALGRVFRASSVAEEPPMRIGGAEGQAVMEPGDMEWFRTAAIVRGAREGLSVRFVTDRPGGWDPALDPQTYGWAGKKPAVPHERD